MGQAWLRVSPGLMLDLCKAEGLQNLKVIKNRLPDDAQLIRSELRHQDWFAHDEVWLLIESAEIPETDEPGEWPVPTFQRVDLDV